MTLHLHHVEGPDNETAETIALVARTIIDASSKQTAGDLADKVSGVLRGRSNADITMALCAALAAQVISASAGQPPHLLVGTIATLILTMCKDEPTTAPPPAA